MFMNFKSVIFSYNKRLEVFIEIKFFLFVWDFCLLKGSVLKQFIFHLELFCNTQKFELVV